MAYSEKQKQNTMAYQADNLEVVRFWVKRGEKGELEAEARRAGYSAVSRYIIAAINEKAGRDLLTMPRERGEKKSLD